MTVSRSAFSDVETADVTAQTPNNVATILDSTSDDTFESYLDASTLTTPTTSVTAKDFRHVYAWSRFGRDTATLYDSVHADTISSDMTSATITQGNGENLRLRRVTRFDQAEVVSFNGNDRATMNLPIGTKTINVSPRHATVVLGDVTHTITDVFRTTLSGASGNLDTVLLSGSAGNDTLRITPTSTLFYSTNFRYTLKGIPTFQTVEGQELGGSDRLIFFDTVGNDTLNATGDTVTISGPGYSHNLKSFDTISAFSRAGEDTATQASPNGILRLRGSWK